MQLMYIVPIGKISQQNKKKYFPSYIGPELKQKNTFTVRITQLINLKIAQTDDFPIIT